MMHGTMSLKFIVAMCILLFHMLTVLMCVNIDGSDKQALIMVGKSLDPIVLKT